jgi:hypothetical protein
MVFNFLTPNHPHKIGQRTQMLMVVQMHLETINIQYLPEMAFKQRRKYIM